MSDAEQDGERQIKTKENKARKPKSWSWRAKRIILKQWAARAAQAARVPKILCNHIRADMVEATQLQICLIGRNRN